MSINIDFNKIYSTKEYGEFKIIDNLGYINNDSRLWVKIKYLTTGYERNVRYDALYANNLNTQDPCYPKIYNVAYIGENVGARNVYKTDYDRWIKMISRCYNKNDKDYKNYGGKGITVCDRWLNFSNYFYDIKLLPGYHFKQIYPKIYQLDKDYLQQNIPKEKRVYSPETCVWLPINVNSKIASNTYYDELPYVDFDGNIKMMNMCTIVN